MAQICTAAAVSSPHWGDRPMADLHVSWTDYHQLIETLALKVYDSGWEFNQIVCLAKGGLRVGDILCRLFDVPLAVLSTASYSGQDNRQRGQLIFSRDLSMTTPNLGSRVLVVDDLVDSGISLDRSIAWLHHKYGFYIEDLRSAVVWYKSCSVTEPDYYSQYLTDDPWIHQPFETYEQMSLDDLAATHRTPQTV
jgi:hypoxanthine phosphoribosyltransferase